MSQSFHKTEEQPKHILCTGEITHFVVVAFLETTNALRFEVLFCKSALNGCFWLDGVWQEHK